MNKSELLDAIATATGKAKEDAVSFLDSFIKTITKALKDGEQVVLAGFGSFSIANRSERNGRNPQTGETITIKASRTPKFKPGKTLKDEVKES